ncbi:MAG: four helix bundle protein [Thermomicrobia bacterium]|nr:four helix bundle protein [Thermomicrobia bacterium]
MARQRARALTRASYAATQQGRFARKWGLTSQIQRAAVSIMSNIAEGFERGTCKEHLSFLSVAKASCAEVRPHRYVALDTGSIDQPTFTALLERSDEIVCLLSGLRAAIGRAQAG